MKKIGIVGYSVNNMFGIGTSYANYFSKFGEVVILTPETPILELDLLVIPGGPDVDPMRYGQKPGFKTGKQCPFREYFDKEILPQYIEQETKIVGICRGFQSIIALYGGTLKQHMYHETNGSDRQARVHDVILKNRFNGEYMYSVNSIHHQSANKVPESFKPLAWHNDGTLEAFKFDLGIALQFHPEETNCEWTTMLINNLLDE